MEVSGQLHASDPLPSVICPGTHWTRVLLGPRASLLSYLYRDSNPEPFIPQPTHYSDYATSFLPSSCIVVTIFTTCINIQDICMLRLFPSSEFTLLCYYDLEEFQFSRVSGPFTAETRVHSWESPIEFYGGKIGSGTRFYPIMRFSSVSIMPPGLSTYLPDAY